MNTTWLGLPETTWGAVYPFLTGGGGGGHALQETPSAVCLLSAGRCRDTRYWRVVRCNLPQPPRGRLTERQRGGEPADGRGPLHYNLRVPLFLEWPPPLASYFANTGVGCGRGGHGTDLVCSVTRFTSTTGRNKQHNSDFRK